MAEEKKTETTVAKTTTTAKSSGEGTEVPEGTRLGTKKDAGKSRSIDGDLGKPVD